MKAAKKEKTNRIAIAVQQQKQASKGFDTAHKEVNTALPDGLAAQLQLEKLEKVVDCFNKKAKKLIDELTLTQDKIYNAEEILLSEEDLTKK